MTRESLSAQELSASRHGEDDEDVAAKEESQDGEVHRVVQAARVQPSSSTMENRRTSLTTWLHKRTCFNALPRRLIPLVTT